MEMSTVFLEASGSGTDSPVACKSVNTLQPPERYTEKSSFLLGFQPAQALEFCAQTYILTIFLQTRLLDMV